MMRNRKLKTILLSAAIIISIVLTNYYLRSIGTQACNAALTNPISSLTIAVPNSAVGLMIFYLGKLIGEWKANLGKGLRFLGAYYFFGGIVVEIGCIIYFIIHLF